MFIWLFSRTSVPTDYKNPAIGLTHLAMTKLPALSSPSSPRLGSILVNYGGPGASGYSSSFTYGKKLHYLAGGRYDLISWDPRGIGRTVPRVDCWEDAFQAGGVKANMLEELGLEIPPHWDTSEGTAVLESQMAIEFAQMKLQAQKCGFSPGADVLKYMGTTTLIRDTERINDVLEGEDALINAIGGSYGTIFVAYLVNMLPHKVGRIVAHGVADPPMSVYLISRIIFRSAH